MLEEHRDFGEVAAEVDRGEDLHHPRVDLDTGEVLDDCGGELVVEPDRLAPRLLLGLALAPALVL